MTCETMKDVYGKGGSMILNDWKLDSLGSIKPYYGLANDEENRTK